MAERGFYIGIDIDDTYAVTSFFTTGMKDVATVSMVAGSEVFQIDQNTDANVFKGRSRFGAGFNNWRGIALCGEGFENGTDLSAEE